MHFGLITLFCLLGILLRLLFDRFFAVPEKTFPWTTLFLNLAGCILAGLIFSFFIQDKSYLLSLVLFCIGFTVFSAYAIDKMKNYKKQRSFSDLIYFLISPTLGVLTAVGIAFWSIH